MFRSQNSNRVRVKCKYDQRCILLGCKLFQLVDDYLMAAVNAIKIANGQRTATQLFGKVGKLPDEFHCGTIQIRLGVGNSIVN